MVDIAKTFGALLIGGIVATLFCGVTQVQVVIYLKLYPKDMILVKVLVFAVWALDALHTVFISHSLWNYFISNFGLAETIDAVPTSLALTIAVTAILTFLVHWFFIYRVFILSRKNYFIAAPLGLIACARLCFACLTTSKLIQLRSLELFVQQFTWSFTTGLSLSAILDILITALMCFLLRSRQKEYSHMNKLLDTLIIYAFENGVLCTLAATLTLITWVTMPSNLIFMAAHFVIIKFYANSLLATINARKNLKPTNRGQFSTVSRLTGDEIQIARTPGHAIIFSESFRNQNSTRPTVNKSYTGSADGVDDDTEVKSPSIQTNDQGNLRINVNTTTVSIADPEAAITPATERLNRPRASRP
ncbi:hypothetical protein FA15DRAFT_671678 [Coprinopsis marcescibilis]|uniref:DUF6534 domain-containing protein n=1 Tax=Coprinopsis marcescibilis TaxID=230819 RepID=A0A5C3KPP5_COPMA|nr:hypothetical protein FA15DRAFT_671678 [Coprinopsis marcescibilis]